MIYSVNITANYPNGVEDVMSWKAVTERGLGSVMETLFATGASSLVVVITQPNRPVAAAPHVNKT